MPRTWSAGGAGRDAVVALTATIIRLQHTTRGCRRDITCHTSHNTGKSQQVTGLLKGYYNHSLRQVANLQQLCSRIY